MQHNRPAKNKIEINLQVEKNPAASKDLKYNPLVIHKHKYKIKKFVASLEKSDDRKKC